MKVYVSESIMFSTHSPGFRWFQMGCKLICNLIWRDIGICGVAVLLIFCLSVFCLFVCLFVCRLFVCLFVCLFFWCGIAVKKIPHCGIAVISNPTVFGVCAFKPSVFNLVKRSYLRYYNTSSIATVYMRTMRYGQWLCDAFAENG